MMRRFLLALLLTICVTLPSGAAAKKLLLIATPPDNHPFLSHEYEAGMKLLAKMLKDVKDLDVEYVCARGKWSEGPDLIGRADGVVLFVTEGAKWIQADPARFAAFQKLAARKGGCSVLHWGMGTRSADFIAGFRDIFGGCHGGPDRRYKVVDVKTEVIKHPITTGVSSIKVNDEFYFKLKMPQGKSQPQSLIRVPIEGNQETVAWAWERPNSGRSFGFSGLHFHKNWSEEDYRRLVTQGVLWTMGLPIPEKGFNVDVTKKDLEVEKRPAKTRK